MEISVAVVMSLDGKLTRHDEPDIKLWASPEEQERFHTLLKEHDCEVLGNGTYRLFKDKIAISAERLRIVLTSKKELYDKDTLPGRLEFSDESPAMLAERLQAQKYKKLIIVGGPLMISEFLNLGIVDMLHVTIEPRLFGQGKPMLATLPVDIHLKLMGSEKINSNGTLLLTYRVEKQ